MDPWLVLQQLPRNQLKSTKLHESARIKNAMQACRKESFLTWSPKAFGNAGRERYTITEDMTGWMDGWNWKVSTVLGDDHEVWQLSY